MRHERIELDLEGTMSAAWTAGMKAWREKGCCGDAPYDVAAIQACVAAQPLRPTTLQGWCYLILDWYVFHPSTDPAATFVASYRGVGRVFMDYELRMVFNEIPPAVRV